ncbi:hypothetical protein LEP1GSC047_1772 [Leptospira inadai serovar Lyme str. 10]|uniref:Uncharacterized protein n=1 Tax=Leptospira inadai serovar Lyme str. 10 TaxID=1049790 RepID=V6HGR4_9LEPT|nr:hypothetical protein LEP1GSC047_1772 [Leptospira inadai serovar Lyme str. 10]
MFRHFLYVNCQRILNGMFTSFKFFLFRFGSKTSKKQDLEKCP